LRERTDDITALEQGREPVPGGPCSLGKGLITPGSWQSGRARHACPRPPQPPTGVPWPNPARLAPLWPEVDRGFTVFCGGSVPAPRSLPAPHLDGLRVDPDLAPRDRLVGAGAAVASVKLLRRVHVHRKVGAVAHQVGVADVVLGHPCTSREGRGGKDGEGPLRTCARTGRSESGSVTTVVQGASWLSREGAGAPLAAALGWQGSSVFTIVSDTARLADHRPPRPAQARAAVFAHLAHVSAP
jgi:hypothetical protein